MKSRKKFLVIMAMCLAFIFCLGFAMIFNTDKKVYADEPYFVSIEKYKLPVDNNGVPDIKTILEEYQASVEATTGLSFDEVFTEVYIYDSVNGDTPVYQRGTEAYENITKDNWTNIFVVFDVTEVNIIDFIREISNNQDITTTIELEQTIATNQINIEKNNIAMLKTNSTEDGYKEFVTISFLPNGLHTKLTIKTTKDENDQDVTSYDWTYIGSNKNFQTLTINASLNGDSIKAQTQYQSLTSTKKYYTFATDLSNIEGADATSPYVRFDAQGHYSFEYTFTDEHGTGTSTNPMTEFYLLDENYYTNNSTINNKDIAPKLWNVKVNQKRINDETNAFDRNKKEISQFGYNNSQNEWIEIEGESNVEINNNNGNYSSNILYPTISYDPTRYDLSYYFVDRSLDSGALEIITSELGYIGNDLCVMFSNGQNFKVNELASNQVTIDGIQYINKMYKVDVIFENLGNYVLQFDFALNKFDGSNIINCLADGAVVEGNALVRNENWNKVRDEQYEIVGTDDLTIFGYQLYYSVYGENENTTAELKKITDESSAYYSLLNGEKIRYYADVTNANYDKLYDDQGNVENNWSNINVSVYDISSIPTTNQPPLFFRYGENQNLDKIIIKRYDKRGGTLTSDSPKIVDNIYRFASSGIENLDNGYYEVFVKYAYNNKNYVQVFAFEVKYTSPTIKFNTIEDEKVMTLTNKNDESDVKTITLSTYYEFSTQLIFENEVYAKNNAQKNVFQNLNKSLQFELDKNQVTFKDETDSNNIITTVYSLEYYKDWTGIGFTNQKVKMDWSESLIDQSPFDVAPNVKIKTTTSVSNATVQFDGENGIAILATRNNTFTRFSTTIEWGPINANRPSKTYIFTIDKTAIENFVEVYATDNNDGNDKLFSDLITRNNVRIIYGQNLSAAATPEPKKLSGATISMRYSLLQMTAGSGINLIGNDAITNGYEVSNKLDDNEYEPFAVENDGTVRLNSNGEPIFNYLPNVNAIFILNFSDDAGNTYTRYLIIDNTSPKMLYRLADENGKYYGQDGYSGEDTEETWKELTDANNNIKTNAQVNYGKYKAIKIDNNLYQFINSINVNNNVLLRTIDSNNYLLVKIANQNQYKICEATVEHIYGSDELFVTDIIGNRTTGKLIVNFDEVGLSGILFGNYPDNIQNIGGESERRQDDNEIMLASTQIGTKQYLRLEWKVLQQNYVVEKIEYDFYPFDLNSNSAQNKNYPFAESSEKSGILYKANDENYATVNGKTEEININTGNKEFYGGSATKQGLYVITRTYNHEQFENATLEKQQNGKTEKDTEVRKYYYYIDRNNIITQLDGINEVSTSPLSIIMGNTNDQSTFGGARFLEDILDEKGNVLTTNKQPLTLNIPVQKYQVSGVTFEGFDYTYNNGEYDKLQYKLFFIPNAEGRYLNGTLLVTISSNSNIQTYNGTFSYSNNSRYVTLNFDGRTITANIPFGNGVGDKICDKLFFEIDGKTITTTRYTQNLLNYQYSINNTPKSDTMNGQQLLNNARNSSTIKKYAYSVYISDIEDKYVGGDTSALFENNKNNSLIFKFELNLSNPYAWWQDSAGFETSNNQNTNDVKLVWNKYNSKTTDFFANIDSNNVSVEKQNYKNGQVQATELGTYIASTNQKNGYISLSEIENASISTKYKFTLKYIHQNDYYQYGQSTFELNLDLDKPYYNYYTLFSSDSFLKQLSANEIADFENYNAQINFENYAFVVNEGWKLHQTTAEDVYARNSKIAYDKLFVSSDETYDLFDLAEAWYRQYDKKYTGTNPENLQSIVPGDSRYYNNKSSFSNYRFDPNLTTEDNEKIYSKYYIGSTELYAGNYYEIIEKDIAGNYRVYTIYVTSENARTIEFDIDDSYLIEKMADEDTAYIVKEKTSQSQDPVKTINIFDSTELNSLITTPLAIKEIKGLGVYYDVSIKNLATNSAAVTIRSANSNIISQVNDAIYQNFSYGKNGNNFEIKFFAASGTYKVYYRTESNLYVNFNSSTSTLSFTVDNSIGSYIKKFQVWQDGTSIYNIGDNDINKPYTLTTTTINSKTTYMLRFDLTKNMGTQIKYTYKDNFANEVSDFKVIGIENTNFNFDPNDANGSNMLVFGDGNYSTTKYDQVDDPEPIQPVLTENIQFTHVAEFYTGAHKVIFRYQTKVYSNVKFYYLGENDLMPTQIRNLSSYTNASTFKNTTEFFNNNKENVNDTYLITFIDPVGNKYEYIIHHYTKLAEISFENYLSTEGQDNQIEFGDTIPQVTDPITMIVSNQPKEYQTEITATRRYYINGNYQTENLGKIISGYSFEESGTYTVTATNGIGLIKTYVFVYTKTDSSTYTITATTIEGVTRILDPSQNIKYDYNQNKIDQYFALKSETIKIVYDENKCTLSDATIIDSTYIYTITVTKSAFQKSFAITLIKYTTDLLVNRMLIDNKPVSANTISAESIQDVVTLKIPNFYGDKSNKLIVKAKFNNTNLGEITGIESDDGYDRTFYFDVAGDYTISISDQAGNIHMFNTTQYFTLSVLNNVIYNINGKDAIKNSYYNNDVILNVVNIKKFYADKNQPYVTEIVYLNGKVIDNKLYTKVDRGDYYTYSFSEYGSYNVVFTAYVDSISEQNKIETTATFTIINKNQARKIHEYIGLNGYQIISIVKDNLDITNLIRQKTGNAIINQFALVGGTGDNVVGGNGRYTITVNAYLGNLVGYKEFTYDVWINDDTTTLIETSIEPGSSTTKTIYLKMNLYQIYSKIGECKVKLNGKTYITINGNTAKDNKVSTYELTSNQAYNVTIETENGNTLLSFMFTKKEPLNAVAIIIIVAVSIVGTGLAITFVLLRKRMRVK